MLTVGNLRKAECDLSKKTCKCVDVASKSGLRATVDVRRLAEIVEMVAMQLSLAKVAESKKGGEAAS